MIMSNTVDETSIDINFKHNNIYELKTNIDVPNTIDTDEYTFGIKISGGNVGINNIYTHVRDMRLECV